MPKEIFNYTNEKLTVVWKPKLCIHSAICFKSLPEVFDPKARPWVNINGTEAQRIVEQVRRCPSGALSIDGTPEPTPLNAGQESLESETRIEVQKNGPFLLQGTCVLKFSDGREEKREGNIALCRCGGSANKPFCDGSHRRIQFNDGV